MLIPKLFYLSRNRRKIFCITFIFNCERLFCAKTINHLNFDIQFCRRNEFNK